jgi:hypothetical protein
MEEQIIKNALELLTPVMEGAMIAAAHYAKGCNRNTVTAQDVQYGMRYCAQNAVGKHMGTLFPELDDEDSEDDESDIEEVDEDDEPFTRYEGTDDETLAQMNKSYDEWDSWVPTNMIESMIKDAIDKSS